jgi:hypothetical protein
MTDVRRPSEAEEVEESTPELLRGAMQDAAGLLRAEGKLLAAEIDANLRGQLSALVVMIIASGLAITGVAFAAAALAAFLAPYVGGPAASYLIVAAAALLLALIIFLAARNRLSIAGLVPRRFLRSLDRTSSQIGRKIHG